MYKLHNQGDVIKAISGRKTEGRIRITPGERYEIPMPGEIFHLDENCEDGDAYPSPVTFKILSVRVELASDITEAGVIAEGIDRKKDERSGLIQYKCADGTYCTNPIYAFRTWWNAAYGDNAYDTKNAVLVISFRRCN